MGAAAAAAVDAAAAAARFRLRHISLPRRRDKTRTLRNGWQNRRCCGAAGSRHIVASKVRVLGGGCCRCRCCWLGARRRRRGWRAGSGHSWRTLCCTIVGWQGSLLLSTKLKNYGAILGGLNMQQD
jgi:hypothetical protein